jgi:hypothetical protein
VLYAYQLSRRVPEHIKEGRYKKVKLKEFATQLEVLGPRMTQEMALNEDEDEDDDGEEEEDGDDEDDDDEDDDEDEEDEEEEEEEEEDEDDDDDDEGIPVDGAMEIVKDDELADDASIESAKQEESVTTSQPSRRGEIPPRGNDAKF